MFKRFLLSIIFFIIIFAQSSFAGEVFKVTSVNFDTSNALIFFTSPDNTSEPVLKNIKLTILKNPLRAYFDIDSAVLTTPVQNWFFNSGGLKQIKVGQFSTNPNKIRVVMYFEEGFDPQKVSFYRINNNIVIKLKDGMCKEDYFQEIYTDEPASSSEFYENLTISNEDLPKAHVAVNTVKNDEVLNQIQQAFNPSTPPAQAVKPVAVKTPEIIKKEIKLRSKYYLDGIYIKSGTVLISGFGTLQVEKPMYLTNPARVVFDISNTIVNPQIRNKEIKINDKETVKIGQFDRNKARIVITSDELEKFIPIFSSDAQSLIIAHSDNVDIGSLFDKPTDAVSYFTKQLNANKDEFIIVFNSPVVHSVKRDYSKLSIYMYNALRYNETTFKNIVTSSAFGDMKIELMPKVGLKLTLPLEKASTVNTYLGADGRAIRIVASGLKKEVYVPPVKKTSCGGHKIVLDAGHGGSDYGAIRSGINEKDINLDIARRVQSILQSKGVSVEMIRDKDETVSLEDRTIFCANKQPDIFVSVHVNSSVKPEISGIETHYYHPQSIELAQTVHACLISEIKANDRGLFKSKFYVINHTEVPAILIEIGFISNDSERAELVSERRKQQTAKAISDGILKYLKSK